MNAVVAVEPILRVPAQPAAGAVAATRAATWLRMRAKGSDSRNPWDQAHDLLDPAGPFAAAGAEIIEAVEPDLEQSWDYQQPAEEGRADVALVYAPFEAGRLRRAVTLDELIDGSADPYLREIDQMLGLV